MGTSAASLAMKSSGSKIAYVVPSRYEVFSWHRALPLGVSDRRFSAIAGFQQLADLLDDGQVLTRVGRGPLQLHAASP